MASLYSAPNPNKRAKYYPLWRHVPKVARCGGGGSWEWKCTLCNGLFKGSYPRVKAHLLHETRKGVDSCLATRDPIKRRKYQAEKDDADRTRDLRIVLEVRKKGPHRHKETPNSGHII